MSQLKLEKHGVLTWDGETLHIDGFEFSGKQDMSPQEIAKYLFLELAEMAESVSNKDVTLNNCVGITHVRD